MKRLSIAFLCSLLLTACAFEKDDKIPPTNLGVTPSVAVKLPRSRRGMRILPKAMTLDERRRAFAIRSSQPRLFSTYSSAPKGALRAPAEFEPVVGVLVRVANDETMDNYFGNLIKGILQAGVMPYLVHVDAAEKREITDYCLTPKGISANQVKWVQSGIDAFWARDYGPWAAYVDGKRTTIDMKYYPTRAYDNTISGKLSKMLTTNVYEAPLYVEGGNFITDGKGTCWTSTGVFEANHISPAQLASLYKKYLGCKKVYTPNPVYQEGTTHLDMLSKLLDAETIIVSYSKAEWGASSAEIDSLDKAARYYAGNTNAVGKPFKVVRIPMHFKDSPDGRIYYTYANSVILNKFVLVPMYGLAADAEALAQYRKLMPNHTVIGIAGAQEVIPWGGSVHCTTMQVHAATTTNPDGKGELATDTQSGIIEKDQWKIFGPYTVSAGDVKARLEGDGDADLYVWKGLEKKSLLTTENFVCSPYEEGSFEECGLVGPGKFFVGVFGAGTSSKFTLTVEYNK